MFSKTSQGKSGGTRAGAGNAGQPAFKEGFLTGSLNWFFSAGDVIVESPRGDREQNLLRGELCPPAQPLWSLELLGGERLFLTALSTGAEPSEIYDSRSFHLW